MMKTQDPRHAEGYLHSNPWLEHYKRMAKEEAIEVEGRVMEALANTQFRIQLDIGGEVIAHVAGKVEISPYDLTRGRIVYRGR